VEGEAAKEAADARREEARKAEQDARRENQEAVEAQAVALRERAEAEAAKTNAAKEKEEAVEARQIAERELAEMMEAREVAARERAEAEEAREVMDREREEAVAARALAHRERRDAVALKDEWVQQKAMKQALKRARKKPEVRSPTPMSKGAERPRSPIAFGQARLWSRSGRRKPSALRSPRAPAAGFESPRSLVSRLVSSEPWFARNPEDDSNGGWTMREGTARAAVLAARRSSLIAGQAEMRTPLRMRRDRPLTLLCTAVHWR
jgi:hypothetical protein